MHSYTGCPRRKGPNSGRVFLRSNYTDITQNTYIQSSMVTEIFNIEKWGLVWCLYTLFCPWRHTRIRLRCNANHSVALGSVRQLVDYVLGANIVLCLWLQEGDFVNFEVLKCLFYLPTLNIAICILFTDIAMVKQVLLWMNTDAVTPKGEFRRNAYLCVLSNIAWQLLSSQLCCAFGKRDGTNNKHAGGRSGHGAKEPTFVHS